MRVEETTQLRFRLPGEPDTSSEIEDVQHWRRVYRELAVGFRDLAQHESNTRRRTRWLQVERLEDRFRFWDARCHELAAAVVATG